MRKTLMAVGVLLSYSALACVWPGTITPTHPHVPHTLARMPEHFLYPYTCDGFNTCYAAGGHVYELRMAGRSGVLMIVITDLAEHEAQALAESWGRTWARLPRIVHETLPPVMHLELGKVEGGVVYLDFERRIVVGTNRELIANAVDTGEYGPQECWEEIILHEVGHALHEGTASWWNENQWNKAVERDGGTYVSDYAMTHPAEDFAESFTGWLALRTGRAPRGVRDHIVGTMRFRAQYFDRRVAEIMFNPAAH